MTLLTPIAWRVTVTLYFFHAAYRISSLRHLISLAAFI